MLSYTQNTWTEASYLCRVHVQAVISANYASREQAALAVDNASTAGSSCGSTILDPFKVRASPSAALSRQGPQRGATSGTPPPASPTSSLWKSLPPLSELRRRAKQQEADGRAQQQQQQQQQQLPDGPNIKQAMSHEGKPSLAPFSLEVMTTRVRKPDVSSSAASTSSPARTPAAAGSLSAANRPGNLKAAWQTASVAELKQDCLQPAAAAAQQQSGMPSCHARIQGKKDQPSLSLPISREHTQTPNTVSSPQQTPFATSYRDTAGGEHQPAAALSSELQPYPVPHVQALLNNTGAGPKPRIKYISTTQQSRVAEPESAHLYRPSGTLPAGTGAASQAARRKPTVSSKTAAKCGCQAGS